MTPIGALLPHQILSSAAVYLGVIFLASWLIVLSGHRPRPGEPVPGPEEMGRRVVAGMYYCNPDDPRGWVPKSGNAAHSDGFTINMRHRSWVVAYNALLIGGGLVFILSLVPWAHFGSSR